MPVPLTSLRAGVNLLSNIPGIIIVVYEIFIYLINPGRGGYHESRGRGKEKGVEKLLYNSGHYRDRK